MSLRRDWPSSAADVQRLHERHAVTLAVLGVLASLVRLSRAVARG